MGFVSAGFGLVTEILREEFRDLMTWRIDASPG